MSMIASLDRQLLCCQNTFYKQFISVYKFTHKYQQKISSPTQAQAITPVPCLPSEVRGRQTAPIATLINKRVPSYSKSRDHHIIISSHEAILINCFAVSSARLYLFHHLCFLFNNFYYRVRLEAH